MGQGIELLPVGCMGLLRYDEGVDALMPLVRPAGEVRRSLQVLGFGLVVLGTAHGFSLVSCV